MVDDIIKAMSTNWRIGGGIAGTAKEFIQSQLMSHWERSHK